VVESKLNEVRDVARDKLDEVRDVVKTKVDQVKGAAELVQNKMQPTNWFKSMGQLKKDLKARKDKKELKAYARVYCQNDTNFLNDTCFDTNGQEIPSELTDSVVIIDEIPSAIK